MRLVQGLMLLLAGLVLGGAVTALIPFGDVAPERADDSGAPPVGEVLNLSVLAQEQEQPPPPWLPMANLKDAEQQAVPAPGEPARRYLVSTNSLGFRGPEVGEKGETYRILILGDSTTYGIGVNDDETWPFFLQEALDPSGQHIEVINGGFPGASSLQGLYVLLKKGLLLEPDLVMVGFGLNDSWYGGYSDWSQIAELIGANPEPATAHLVERYLVTKDGEPDRAPRVTMGQYLDTLYEFKDLSQKANFSLAYFVWPHSACFGTDNIEPSYHYFTFQAAQLTDTPLVNMRDVLERKPEAYLYDPIHCTRQGNQAVAAFVAEELRENYGKRLGPLWNRAVNRIQAIGR